MFEIEFEVDGEPVGKGRPRFARRGAFVSTYTAPKTKAYEDSIIEVVKQKMYPNDPIEGPCSVNMILYVGIPKSYSKKRTQACMDGEEMPMKKPDLDNVAKAFLDAMNGIVYKDDVQVMRLVVQKVYDSHPSVVVHVKEMLK